MTAVTNLGAFVDRSGDPERPLIIGVQPGGEHEIMSRAGFDALETMLAADVNRGSFCFGNAPGLVECYLIPQVESARRFKVDMARWPLISAIDAACAGIEAFAKAAPGAQPDA